MKNILFVLTVLISTLRLTAQTNSPARLALISESADASTVADILTAELSSRQNLQLLERNEIEKVYREQGLSAGNKNYLKLGQILGADGLLLLEVVRTKQATNLMARLIAVKPGVILTDGSFAWPLKDTAQWAESVSTYLNLFLPKLSVLAKDAIPISVVNLRSAVASTEGTEAERQLKLLTIQRLSQEKELFVLERQRMQLLSEEKAMKTDDSAFWNGSYLLEGVVDQNGYSKETITVNGRLTPPKGGAPLLFEVSGNRTNLSEVINRLAAKTTELLKIHSNVPKWNAADEAAKYFEEAKWALRWGVLPEAQAAADSAWALGKRDVDCATVRVKAYEVPPDTGGYQKREFTNPSGTNEVVQTAIEEAGPNHIWGLTLHEQNFGGTKVVQYVSVGKFPDLKSIDFAMRALELYYEFSQTMSADEPKAGSAWYHLGIEDLTVASQVLQHFHFVPESQKPAAEKLAELRALARSVAGWIAKSPLIHDSYFVGDRVAVYDELYHFEESPGIFGLEVEYGFLWQENPEDCAVIYHELMSSPVFRYIHVHFWLRDLQTPRLVAWNENDRQRVPKVWNNFIGELDASTNVLLQLEGKSLALADADNESKMAVSFTNLFNCMFENRDALVANPAEVLYLYWGVDDLVRAKTSSGIVTDIGDSLNHLFYSEYRPKLGAMDQEYQQKTVPAGQFLSTFEKQKRYLKENKPYEFMGFAQLFSSKDYSETQAHEIQPLVVDYKSNLVAQSQNASGMQKGQLMGAVAQVGFLENDVNCILNPPRPKVQTPQPTVAKTIDIELMATNAPEIVTNVITVSKFLTIPLGGLMQLNGFENVDRSTVTITAHHWFDGKLLLNFDYIFINNQTGSADGSAIALLDSATESWNVVNCPKEEIQLRNNFYHRTVLVHGDLFNCDGGQIKKYDFQNRQWQVLPVLDGNNYELFAIDGHLYAASREMIFEILDGGKSTRILASSRRNPSVSTLDRENLGIPTLFEGPNKSLRACTASKISTWIGDDWREDSIVPPASSQPEVFTDGLLFRQDGFMAASYQNGVLYRQANGVYGVLNSQDEISCLANEASAATLCLKGSHDKWNTVSMSAANSVQVPKPLWEMPNNLLPNLPAALRQSDLYILEDYFAAHASVNDRHEIVQENINTNDEYNAALLCFSHDLPTPQKLYLKFNSPDAKTPAWVFPATHLLIFGGNSKGIWLLPTTQLDPAIATQKQIQLDQKAQAAAAITQARQALLAKCDSNHNGIIDPDEKEAALDDPAFIESELGAIDANHNGWLDAAELAYFDANKNKIMEPKEQAGIDIAQHLLAERLLKKFAVNGDGLLDRPEFNNLFQSSFAANTQPMNVFSAPFPDDNHDAKIDLGELEAFLKQQTRRGLRSHGMPGAALFNQIRTNASQPVDPRQMFKAAVESYWQNPGGNTSGTPGGKVQ